MEFSDINKEAMQKLKEGQTSVAYALLSEIREMVNNLEDSPDKFRILYVYYNNMSCLFNKTRKNEKALVCLFKAIELEKFMEDDIVTVANTNLNLCKILSSKGDHEKAHRYALKAVCLLKNKFEGNKKHINKLIKAYKILGKEYEELGMANEAKDCLHKAEGLNSESNKRIRYFPIDSQADITSHRHQKPMKGFMSIPYKKKNLKSFHFNFNRNKSIPRTNNSKVPGKQRKKLSPSKELPSIDQQLSQARLELKEARKKVHWLGGLRNRLLKLK